MSKTSTDIIKFQQGKTEQSPNFSHQTHDVATSMTLLPWYFRISLRTSFPPENVQVVLRSEKSVNCSRSKVFLVCSLQPASPLSVLEATLLHFCQRRIFPPAPKWPLQLLAYCYPVTPVSQSTCTSYAIWERSENRNKELYTWIESSEQIQIGKTTK